MVADPAADTVLSEHAAGDHAAARAVGGCADSLVDCEVVYLLCHPVPVASRLACADLLLDLDGGVRRSNGVVAPIIGVVYLPELGAVVAVVRAHRGEELRGRPKEPGEGNAIGLLGDLKR